jgi:EmrB/QacA subfamily drug resistance transporter
MSSAECISTSSRVLPFRESLLAMVGISLVNMLGALDQTVVSTALPSIVSELKGFEYYAWVITAYLLLSVVTVPVFGRLGDYFGRKPFVVAAISTFTAASVLCGIAHSMGSLIFGRALQGIGGGMMVGTAFASIPDLFPDPRARVRWHMVMAAAYGIGTAAGPSLGGLLTEYYSWRWAFLVNLPVGVVSLFCVVLYLPSFRHQRSKSERVRVDWPGALLVSIGLGCAQMCVELLPKNGWTLTTAWLLAAVILSGIGLVWCEKRADYAIIPLDLFKNRSLVTVFMLSLWIGFVMYSLIFFSPLLLQGAFGLSPQQAGLLVTPLAGCVAIGSILNSNIATTVSKPSRIVMTGYALLAFSCLGIGLATRSTPHWLLEAAMVTGGVGMGFIFNNLNVFSQELAGRGRFGITTALIQSTRMVGGMLGTALIGMLVTRTYVSHVGSAATASFGNVPPLLLRKLQDPQILIDRHAATIPLPLLEVGRHVLERSIHLGFLLTAAGAAVAMWQVRGISHLKFTHHTAEEAADTITV